MTVIVESSYGSSNMSSILKAVGIGEPLKIDRLTEGAFDCVLGDGRTVQVQFSKKYKRLGIRQDIFSETLKVPVRSSDLYVYVDNSQEPLRVCGGVFTKQQVIEKCRTGEVRYDSTTDKHYVSWTQ